MTRISWKCADSFQTIKISQQQAYRLKFAECLSLSNASGASVMLKLSAAECSMTGHPHLGDKWQERRILGLHPEPPPGVAFLSSLILPACMCILALRKVDRIRLDPWPTSAILDNLYFTLFSAGTAIGRQDPTYTDIPVLKKIKHL